MKVKSLSRVPLFATPWTNPIRLLCPWDSPGLRLPAVRETRVQFLGREDPLEKTMATHSQHSCLENPRDGGACLSVAQTVKRLPAMWEIWIRSLGWEDPLEKEMATHSSTLSWRIPRMEEPGGLQSMGSQRVGHYWATSLSFFLSFLTIMFLKIILDTQHVLATNLSLILHLCVTFFTWVKCSQTYK